MNGSSWYARPPLIILLLAAEMWLLSVPKFAVGQEQPVQTTDSSVERFIQQIQSAHRDVRRQADTTLRQIGPNDVVSVPLILDALKSNDRTARSKLISALQRIGRPAVPSLVQAVDQNDTMEVRWAAAMALGQIRAVPKSSIPCLGRALSDEAAEVRRASVAAILRFGKDADGAIADLAAAAVDDSEMQVRAASASALGTLRLKPRTSVLALQLALSDDNPLVRRASLTSFGEFGPDAAPAVAAIVRAIDDPDRSVRTAAFTTLTKLGTTASGAAPRLLAVLDDEDRHRSRMAAAALRRLGVQKKESVAQLLSSTKQELPHVRGNAAWVLGAYPHLSQQAMPRLIEMLEDENEIVVRDTLLAVTAIGRDADKAVASIIELTSSDDRRLQAIAEQALRRIAPDRAAELIGEPYDAVHAHLEQIKDLRVGPRDWPQLGGSRSRNHTPADNRLPMTWNIGRFDRRTGEWDSIKASNVKWFARLGSQTYGNPVVANGKVYVGTNNGAGYLQRYPAVTDLGCLLCFDESDGQFLWQHSSEKLATGRVHDWPLQGICSSPVIEGERLWFVTNRGEVVCLDTDGFHDNEDDGPIRDELAYLGGILGDRRSRDAHAAALKALAAGTLSKGIEEILADAGEASDPNVDVDVMSTGEAWEATGDFGGVARDITIKKVGPWIKLYKSLGTSDKREADVVWKFDMMKNLGVSQHNMATCSPAIWGDVLFICTSNGLDESHASIPAPEAPSFIALDKNTGAVLWTDNSPGKNILHGQWSCPVVGVFDGVPQVIFPGGDGWIYSFRADRWSDSKPELVWKFDVNAKESKWILGGEGDRNNVIAYPVIYDGLVYVAVGQDPEHGEGDGHLWCIDPTRRGDVSPELVVDVDGNIMPHRRTRAIVTEPWEKIFHGVTTTMPDAGTREVPEPIRTAFANSGYQIPQASRLKLSGNRTWFLDVRIEEREHRFRLQTTSSHHRQGKLHYRVMAERRTNGERVVANPNSAVVWHYDKVDQNDDGEIDFEEEFHRTIGSPTIKNDILVITDFSGLVHCLNAKSGTPFWTCDLLAQSWGTPLVVGDRVYVGDEDGDIAILPLAPQLDDFAQKSTVQNWDGVTIPRHEINMGSSVYATPIAANDVLYVATKTKLFAIADQSD